MRVEEGCFLQVRGAEVTVYRIQDPVRPDDSEDFDEGVLEAPIVSKQACLLQHCLEVKTNLTGLFGRGVEGWWGRSWAKFDKKVTFDI